MNHGTQEHEPLRLQQVSSSRMAIQWISIAVLGLASGCGSGDGIQLVPVQGQVTLDGQPLDRATVTFQPADGRPSVGVTDDKGFYRLQYTATRYGALVGQHSVSVTSEVRGTSDEKTGESIAGRKEILPARYRDNSELSAVVERGTKEYNFPLTSK